MVLKDLIANRDEDLEKKIEELISGRIHYGLDPHEIVFTFEGSSLSNMAKVLTYLVATLGWKYVDENFTLPSTKPADLAEALGIPGNTLRPILKKLTDKKLIKNTNGEYSIREANIANIERTLKDKTKSAAVRKKKSYKTSKAGKDINV